MNQHPTVFRNCPHSNSITNSTSLKVYSMYKTRRTSYSIPWIPAHPSGLFPNKSHVLLYWMTYFPNYAYPIMDNQPYWLRFPLYFLANAPKVLVGLKNPSPGYLIFCCLVISLKSQFWRNPHGWLHDLSHMVEPDHHCRSTWAMKQIPLSLD